VPHRSIAVRYKPHAPYRAITFRLIAGQIFLTVSIGVYALVITFDSRYLQFNKAKNAFLDREELGITRIEGIGH
jgi:hypothetical protein